ncbi:MAG: YidH family protein [Candidatus Baltobacteraceae bacterium]
MDDVNVRASDALANERTYLAYVRTALAFVAFGFVVARFALFSREISIVARITVPHAGISSALGVAMVIAGVVIGVVGGWRYGATDRGLRTGRPQVFSPVFAYVGVAFLAAIGALVCAQLLRL